MKKILLVVLAILLTSCGLIKNRDDQYLQAKTRPVLRVPVGVSREKLGNDYPISGNQYPTSNKPVSIIPPGSAVDHH